MYPNYGYRAHRSVAEGGGTKFSITKIRHHQTNLHTDRLVCNRFNLMYPNYGYKAHRNVAEQIYKYVNLV